MLFLRRVYRCACLQAHIEECFLNDKITILDINYHLNDNFNGRLFSTTVGENNNDYLFTCEDHLKIVLIGGADKKKHVMHPLKMTMFLFVSNIRI